MSWNLYVFLRILLGLLFTVVGAEKLISPYQNFLYVVQSYELFPLSLTFLEEMTARILPWIEFLLGVFLLLGLWLKSVLRGFFILIGSFMVSVIQALIRKLPIDHCGCFGEMFSVSLPVILILDSFLLLCVLILMAKHKETSLLSLDQFYI